VTFSVSNRADVTPFRQAAVKAQAVNVTVLDALEALPRRCPHTQRRGSGLRTADAHFTAFKWEATRLRAIASIAGRYPEGCI
jgi:hypothetical protein